MRSVKFGFASRTSGVLVTPEVKRAEARLLYIDNLRWTMIILVISMHAADTYSPLGNWYFVDRRPLSTAALLTFAAWQMYLQCFFMGLLFFVSGLFVPSSLHRKGTRQFIRDRAIRLGVPTLLYMFCIGPLTEYYVAHSWTSTESTSFAKEWIKHIRNGQFLQENGPLWFCVALLIFSITYALPRLWRTPDLQAGTQSQPPATGKLIVFASVMAVFTFLVRIAKPSPILNMHLEDFPQYILLFSSGIVAARRRWLSRLSFSTGIRWMSWVLPCGFAAWLALISLGGALSGRAADYFGGLHWQNAALCVWECFTCVAMAFGLLVIFRDKFNSQGRLAKFLSANAFSVYVFHPPVLIAGARLLWGVSWPPLLKFALLTVTSAFASFVLSSLLLRKIPVLSRVLA